MATGKITIMKETTSVVNGRDKITSEEHFKCWSDISDLLSNEKYEALQQSLEETAVFKVRRCKKTVEMWMRNKEYSVVFKGEKYEIYSMTPVESESKYLLKCNRVS